ncbi:hypothetical protein [Weissella bombi]|uniref:hypothetical protein n=1 Tax=Weissella bombi TaxID=1505725 RepID=UPI003AF2B9C8
MANKFTNFKFTTEGKETLTEVLAAKGSIAITQVYTFATKLTDALVFTQLSSLNPKQIKPVGTVSAKGNTVETRLQIDNADLTSDYNLQGIALVGTFNKTNFVLGYINTNEATNVPKFNGSQVQTIALDVSFAISDTSVITINTQTAGMLTVADYNALVAFIKEQVAPLSIDKKVVHLTNNEIINGIKTFKQKITGSISGNANTVDYINVHQITTNVDLNTLTMNGNYLSTLETKSTSNKPSGTSEQYSLISTSNLQIFSDIKTDKVYIRNQIKTNTFTSWKLIIEDVDQTLNAQFNFTKLPNVNNEPVALKDDLQTEIVNRTNADKDINKSLATESFDRKNGDNANAKAIQDEATARSNSDTDLTKSVNDVKKQLQSEVTNRANEDNKFDAAAVHKAGNETIGGNKTFSNDVNVNHIMQANWFYKHVPAGTASSQIMEIMDDNLNDGKPHSIGKYYSGKADGSGISITGNGLTAIGGGESSSAILDAIVNGKTDSSILPPNTLNSENLILSSDEAIYFLQNQQNSPNYANIWRLNNGGYWDRYDTTSKKWINVIPNVSNLLAQDDSVVHKSGNENISGTKSFSSAIKGSLSGNASTAEKLKTARTIGGVNFDGGSNINLPGVNVQGNQNTTGNAASATKLATARKVNGTAFDGTRDINVNAANDGNLVHQSGNETIAGYKTFNNRLTVKGVSQADYFYKTVTSKNEVPILEFEDSATGSTFIQRMGSYYSQDSYGGGLALSAGGLTVIGGGESPFNVINKIKDGTIDSTAIPSTTPGSEDMIVASDQSIYFLPNFQNNDSYNAMWRMTQGGYLQSYNGKSWVNVLPSNSGLVAQDSSVVHKSGNETIGGTKTFSSTINGSVSGNAASANKLTTARKINGVNFNGTGDINVKASNDSDIVHKSSNETIGGNNTFSGTTTFKNNVVLQGNVSSRGNAKTASIKYQSVTIDFYETAVGVQVSVYGSFTSLTAKGRATYLKIGNIPSNITNPPIKTYASSSSSSGVPSVTNNTGVHVDFVFDTNGEVGIYAGHTLTNKSDTFNDLWTEPRTSTYWFK